jgi:predicted nucleotidyltransferase
MSASDSLQQVFSTRERIRILEKIAAGRGINVNAISRESEVNKGLVSRYLQLLLRLGMVEKSGRSYRFVPGNRLSRAIKILLNVSSLDVGRFHKSVKGIGLYGSYAKGTNTEKSDIDIWIKVGGIPSEHKIAEMEHGLGKRLGKDVHILVLDRKKLARLKANDPVFYYSLAFGSFILWGEGIEDRIR